MDGNFRPVFVGKKPTSNASLELTFANHKNEEDVAKRREETHLMIEKEAKREKERQTALEKAAVRAIAAVDDTDGLDEEAEYNQWREREIARIKRNRREAEESEKSAIELQLQRDAAHKNSKMQMNRLEV